MNKNLSNSILSLNQKITNNSNAIINLGNYTNSNVQFALIRDTSNALLRLTTNNSNAILNLNLAGGCSDCCEITQGPLSSDIVMTRNCQVDPIKQIHIVGNMTIDGQGANVIFSNPDMPQFVIDAGVTVTLTNIQLLRLNAKTFQFGPGASIVIGKGVTFELVEDIAFAGGTIAIDGTVNDPTVFKVKSDGCENRFIITPTVVGTPQGPIILKNFNIGVNTLQFENTEFIGLESALIDKVQLPDGSLFVGSIALAGCSHVNVASDTDANFFIEGDRNGFEFLNDGLALRGFILFSDDFESELHFFFKLQSPISGNPQIIFGDNLLFVSSAMARASVIFDDYWVTIVNEGQNSFVTDANAFIGGRHLELLNFPIKQTSTDLILDSVLQLHTDQINSIDASFIRSIQPSRRVITAIGLQRDKERQELLGKMSESLNSLKNNSKASTASKRKAINKKQRNQRSRAITLPSFFDLVVNGQVQQSACLGNIKVENGEISQFGIDDSIPLNLYMLGNGKLSQKESDVTLKQNDTIFVRGDNNVVHVTETLMVQGQFIVDENSELIFEFDQEADDATIIFDTSLGNNMLTIPENTIVRFKGTGTVIFTDGFTIKLESNDIGPNTALLYFSDNAVAQLFDSATMTISGRGRLWVDDGARINVGGDQHLIIGNSPPEGALASTQCGGSIEKLPQDDIDILINRNAVVHVARALNEESIAGIARLTMHKAQYRLMLEQSGILKIGDGGIFEINALNGVQPTGYFIDYGYLTDFTIRDNAQFLIQQGGEFLLGRNKTVSTVIPAELPIHFDMNNGRLDGVGIVSYEPQMGAIPPLEGPLNNHSIAAGSYFALDLVHAMIAP